MWCMLRIWVSTLLEILAKEVIRMLNLNEDFFVSTLLEILVAVQHAGRIMRPRRFNPS